MAKKRVAILFGGKSGEHEVSITSAVSVYNALDKNKYDVIMIGIDKTGRWLLPAETRNLAESQNPRLVKLNQEKESVALVPYESSKQLVRLDQYPEGRDDQIAQAPPSSATAPATRGNQTRGPLPSQFDVIIPILHGTYGEDGTIQGLLELANIPYVGTGVLGSAVGMDKDVSRRLLKAAGIPVVPTISIRKHEFEKDPNKHIENAINQMGLPLFVKPANMGSSVGVSKIKNKSEALEKLKLAFAYDHKVLIEKGVDARELECAVLGNEEPKASIVGEIIPRHEFYSYEAKYIDDQGADLKIPAELPPDVVMRIQELSTQAFQVLECSGMARVDFFLDRKTNELYLNEINTIPGFTKISMYPKLWAASGIPYSELLDRLIELALEKHQQKNSLRTTYDPHEE